MTDSQSPFNQAPQAPAAYTPNPDLAPPPMGAPVQAPAENITGKRFKLHISYIWGQLLGVIVGFGIAVPSAVLPMIASSGEEGKLSSAEIALIISACSLVIVAISVVATLVSYKFRWYQFDEKEFSLYSGFITKKKVHIPYNRVQSVNHNASLFQRIVGVCTVSIDTAGGSSNKAVTVPYITNAAAEQLRYELFSRKSAVAAEAANQPTAAAPAAAPSNALDQVAGDLGRLRGAFGGAEVDTGTVTYQVGLTGKELFFTGIANSAGVVGGIVVAILGLVGSFSAVIGSMVESALDSAFTAAAGNESAISPDEIMQITQGSEMLVGVLITLGVIVSLTTWGIGVASSCLNYGGFSAVRRGNRVEVEHGLVQKQFSGLDIDRVQSVVVRQSLIRRILGYCEISLGRVDAVGEENKANQNAAKLNAAGLVIHPFVKKSRVPEILEGLIPEYASAPQQVDPLPRVATRRAIVRRCIWRGEGFWLLLGVLVLQAILHFVTQLIPGTAKEIEAVNAITSWLPSIDAVSAVLVVLFILMIAWDLVGAVLWARGSGCAFSRHFYTVRNGGFTTEAINIPRKKIQFGYTRRNPFQVHSKVATLNVVTASGVGGTTTTLWDVDEKTAAQMLDWLKPGGNMLE